MPRYLTVNKYSRPSVGVPSKSSGRLATGRICFPGVTSSSSSRSSLLRLDMNEEGHVDYPTYAQLELPLCFRPARVCATFLTWHTKRKQIQKPFRLRLTSQWHSLTTWSRLGCSLKHHLQSKTWTLSSKNTCANLLGMLSDFAVCVRYLHHCQARCRRVNLRCRCLFS